MKYNNEQAPNLQYGAGSYLSENDRVIRELNQFFDIQEHPRNGGEQDTTSTLESEVLHLLGDQSVNSDIADLDHMLDNQPIGLSGTPRKSLLSEDNIPSIDDTDLTASIFAINNNLDLADNPNNQRAILIKLTIDFNGLLVHLKGTLKKPIANLSTPEQIEQFKNKLNEVEQFINCTTKLIESLNEEIPKYKADCSTILENIKNSYLQKKVVNETPQEIHKLLSTILGAIDSSEKNKLLTYLQGNQLLEEVTSNKLKIEPIKSRLSYTLSICFIFL